MVSRVIGAAKLLSQRSHVIPGKFLVSELFFEVPKDYSNQSSGVLQLFGRSVTKHERPVVPPSETEKKQAEQKPWLVFLQGGPGFGNPEPQDSPVTHTALERGYQVLFLDYRGVGLSSPVSAATLALQGNAEKQADHLKLLRQDNIVNDLEAVRACLTSDYPEEKKKWSLFGQSFGGFVSLTYLSRFPQGLREVFLTGGLAPVGKKPEQVYEATFKKVMERNKAHYEKYPEDIESVHRVARFIQEKKRVDLPGGGFMTVPRLLTLGIAFGAHGGLDSVHSNILKLKTDLDQFGFFTRASLADFEQATSFDSNIIYAILHEAIYTEKPGVASNWAAYRVGKALEEFSWLENEPAISECTAAPLYFSGEMIFPLHFETYPELVELREAAEILARYDEWPELYDQEQLRKNTVPVYAAGYIDDMYVDYNFAKETAALVKGTKVYETNQLYHSALRGRTGDVMRELFRLRDDPID
ncbi:Proline iminopeptidase [Colletotrichum tanaceti]|uniref:Proline iminopeptidase n=1 Tax=Colletotrichum tanaceti TaxID=1306861 RepID=A0A4U6XP52_9PEZI|nr:Proline iminopeptidase [Colletotrichum tanaceti]TKW57565.1 Proline iminopeptidase [Colletotrichum tanaceti]